jgi:hypothetical protein
VLSGLCLAQDGGKSADLVAKRCTYVLRAVRAKILDGWENVAKKYLSIDKLTEACIVRFLVSTPTLNAAVRPK